MSVLSQLNTASYKGVAFSVPAEVSTTGGRKKVIHEFVNSDKRLIQDQGKYQKVFNIKGIITDSDGQYFQRRNALINVLEERDGGILSHPFFGKVKVLPEKYTISESFTELGRAEFSMVFYRAEDKVVPLPDAYTDFNVQEKKKSVIKSVGDEIVSKFSVNRGFPFNFSSAAALLAQTVAIFSEITTTFDRALGEVDNFSRNLNDFRNGIFRLINLPSQLVGTLDNLYNSAMALFQTPEEAFLSLEKFFTSGDNAPIILRTTIERIERLANRNLIKQYLQVGALAYAYGASVEIDFFTVREIDVYLGKLNTQYDKVFPVLTNNDIADNLRSLRGIASEFFDKERLNVKRIVSFETQPTTLQELTYRLYGNLDNFDRLAKLNSITNPDFISGTLEIFR